MAMRMDKKIKSFAVCISNAEAVGCLDDVMAGRLFKALFDYASNGTVPKWSDKALTAVFSMFKSQIDKNVEAYHEKCEKNAINARKRYATINVNKSEATVGGRLPSHTAASRRSKTLAVVCDGIPSGDNYNRNNKEDIDKNEENIKERNIVNTAENSENIALGDFVGKSDELKNSQTFERVWALYGKPVGNKTQLEQQWNGLSDEEREAILDYVPRYVAARPDPKYRKNFCNFLANRTWETEQITPPTYGKYKRNSDTISKERECARNDATSLAAELIAKCDAGSERKD